MNVEEDREEMLRIAKCLDKSIQEAIDVSLRSCLVEAYFPKNNEVSLNDVSLKDGIIRKDICS